MESVYLETSFINHLVTRPSRDLLVAAHQQITQERWAASLLSSQVFIRPPQSKAIVLNAFRHHCCRHTRVWDADDLTDRPSA